MTSKNNLHNLEMNSKNKTKKGRLRQLIKMRISV